MFQKTLFLLNAHFRSIWLARTISFFGDTIATTAIIAYVYQLTESGTAVGFVLLAQALPRLFGPIAGSFVDRIDQRCLMIVCDIGQTLIFAFLTLILPPLPVLFGTLFIASCLTTLFAPAGRSALPVLVPSSDLPTANALLSFGVNASLAFGPFLGGWCVATFGVRGAFLVNTCSFLCSVLLLYRLPSLPPVPSTETGSTSLLLSTRLGLQYVFHHKTARAVVIGLFLGVAFGALDNVALVALAQNTFQSDARSYGLLASMYGMGMVAGSLVVLRWGRAMNPAALLLFGFLLLGVGGLCTGLAPFFLLAVVAQGIAGIGNGLENIGNETLIQRTVPRAMLGRVFGTVFSAAFIASSLAYAVGGFLLDATSPRTVFVIAGMGVLTVLLILWNILPRNREE